MPNLESVIHLYTNSMRQIDKHRRKLKRQAQKENRILKKQQHEQMIREANLRHDLEHGPPDKIIEYYKEYIQGTGMRQSR